MTLESVINYLLSLKTEGYEYLCVRMCVHVYVYAVLMWRSGDNLGVMSKTFL